MSICGFGHRQLLVRKFWYVELSFIFAIARIFPRWKTSFSSFNQFSLYRIAGLLVSCLLLFNWVHLSIKVFVNFN